MRHHHSQTSVQMLVHRIIIIFILISFNALTVVAVDANDSVSNRSSVTTVPKRLADPTETPAATPAKTTLRIAKAGRLVLFVNKENEVVANSINVPKHSEAATQEAAWKAVRAFVSESESHAKNKSKCVLVKSGCTTSIDGKSRVVTIVVVPDNTSYWPKDDAPLKSLNLWGVVMWAKGGLTLEQAGQKAELDGSKQAVGIDTIFYNLILTGKHGPDGTIKGKATGKIGSSWAFRDIDFTWEALSEEAMQ